MTFVWILALGFWHGLHPDHAAAATSMALRSRTPAWQAALRIALGHAVALAAMAVGVRLLPTTLLDRAESWSKPLSGIALGVIGVTLVVGAYRPRSQAPENVHPTARGTGTLALGLTLGLGGARSLLVLLPAIAGPGQAIASIALYVVGIAAGCVTASLAIDVVRKAAAGATRWVNLAGGSAALVAGAWLVVR